VFFFSVDKGFYNKLERFVYQMVIMRVRMYLHSIATRGLDCARDEIIYESVVLSTLP